MKIQELVQDEINRIVKLLQETQSTDGSWRFCFESGPITDAYMIILLRSLDIREESLIRKLAERIASLQQANGSWKLFNDEKDGNLSATIEAYYALLFSGYHNQINPHMLSAKQFILSKGGITEADPLTKVILSATGQYPWQEHFHIPIELFLLPPTLPVSFYDFVGYARVHVAPILVLADQQFTITTERTPDLSDLYVSQTYRVKRKDIHADLKGQHHRFFIDSIKQFIQQLSSLPSHVHSVALQYAERFMLDRIEPDGTLYSYASSTFLMIYALMALGYSKHDPIIQKAIEGLKTLICRTNGYTHLQNSTSTIWDTALLSYAIQEAGVSPRSLTIQKANQYLLSRQQDRYADWSLRNPGVVPGGWGFSDINTINPDVDDTTAALRSLSRIATEDETILKAWHRGINWVLSMQNEDGGWPAFEKNTDKEILTWLPFDGADSIFTDPSSADLTGRTLEFLGHYTSVNDDYPSIQKGIHWLVKHQEEDGSWYGRWGICYIYGTWAALTGLQASGISLYHPSILKAVHWLESIQNSDGGWGESCYSDIDKQYTPLGVSTPSQTAWALDALIAVSTKPTDAIIRGITYLIKAKDQQHWTFSYPTGAGLPGGFYIHYHSYRYIWPLLALAHYQQKFK